MKTMKYWEFRWDNGSSYGSINGNFTTLDSLKENLEKSEAVKGQMYSLHNGYGEYIDSKDIERIQVDVTQNDDWANVDIFAIGKSTIKKKVGETSEIKEAGKPYKPAETIYENVEIDLSERKIKTSVRLREFNLDGIPQNYGKME